MKKIKEQWQNIQITTVHKQQWQHSSSAKIQIYLRQLVHWNDKLASNIFK